MRKLIYSVHLSLDGYIARTDHSYDFLEMKGDHQDDFIEDLSRYNVALMGRKTYEVGLKDGFVTPDLPLKQIVISKSLKSTSDARIDLISENSIFRIKELKQSGAGNILLSGGSKLAAELLKANLIDELQFRIHPILIGKGIPAFDFITASDVKLNLIYSKTYSGGVVLLAYTLIKSN